MKKQLIKFFIQIAILTAILYTLSAIVFSLLLPQYYIKIIPWTILFVAVITVALHTFLFRAAQKRAIVFTRMFLGLNFLKLFFYLIFIVAYMLISKERPAVFVIVFFVCYIVFTIYETVGLLKTLNAANKTT